MTFIPQSASSKSELSGHPIVTSLSSLLGHVAPCMPRSSRALWTWKGWAYDIRWTRGWNDGATQVVARGDVAFWRWRGPKTKRNPRLSFTSIFFRETVTPCDILVLVTIQDTQFRLHDGHEDTFSIYLTADSWSLTTNPVIFMSRLVHSFMRQLDRVAEGGTRCVNGSTIVSPPFRSKIGREYSLSNPNLNLWSRDPRRRADLIHLDPLYNFKCIPCEWLNQCEYDCTYHSLRSTTERNPRNLRVNIGFIRGLPSNINSAITMGSGNSVSRVQKDDPEFPPEVPGEPTVFSVIMFNDNYELEAVDGLGGLAEITTLIKEQRRRARHHITTVNGDFMVATSLSNLTKGGHIIDIFNKMEVDYVVLGNHEFDYGPNETRDRIKESNFKWFGSNVFDRQGGELFGGCISTEIKEIGLFGVCTAETINLSFPGETHFSPVVETSQKIVDELRAQGCDAIIAVTHQSMHEDEVLARRVKGINLIIGGHDHIPFANFENETLIYKAGQNAQYLGRLDLHLSKPDPKKPAHVHLSWNTILNRNTLPDHYIRDVIRGHLSQLDALKLKTCATTRTLLESKTYMVRSRETSMGDLLADAVRESFGTETAVIQGGSIRGDSVYEPWHKITYHDIQREFPLPNTLEAFHITGSNLKAGLEQGVRHLPAQAGCFPQVSGISMRIDPTKPPGQRITRLRINGEPYDPSRSYTCVATRFVRDGGDGYDAMRLGETQHNHLNGTKVDVVFVAWLERKGEIDPQTDGRTVIVQEEDEVIDFGDDGLESTTDMLRCQLLLLFIIYLCISEGNDVYWKFPHKWSAAVIQNDTRASSFKGLVYVNRRVQILAQSEKSFQMSFNNHTTLQIEGSECSCSRGTLFPYIPYAMTNITCFSNEGLRGILWKRPIEDLELYACTAMSGIEPYYTRVGGSNYNVTTYYSNWTSYVPRNIEDNYNISGPCQPCSKP
ncbi:hypothetical protein PROFUN_13476 [Planoprotostelium fungivorum]|uniref:5'-nucleotidase n=1 Tax=Planoprotostelium fungivorum TaxID=1890364 RepID=A0A2P6N3V9_9EUKA|nr:hypothetical protein PROFUN_13476 [Planoprotostelium fungivorum]